MIQPSLKRYVNYVTELLINPHGFINSLYLTHPIIKSSGLPPGSAREKTPVFGPLSW